MFRFLSNETPSKQLCFINRYSNFRMTVVQNMVLHGRRAGTASPKPKSTVLSGSDLNRIRAQLDRDSQNKKALERAQEDAARLEASKERQTGWSNTLAGQRRAKLGKGLSFSKITHFLERILMEHIETKISLESKQQIESMCSSRIWSRN